MMTTLEILLLLNQIPSCNGKKIAFLSEALGSIDDIVKQENLDYMKRCAPFGAHLSRGITTSLKHFDPVRERIVCQEKGIQIISYFDEAYPSLLREIHDPPLVLYVKGGALKNTQPMISMVGSRNASVYGRQMALRLATDLVLKGITIVSGMARGIDGAAHTGAMQAGGRTIAVLGSGVDVVYPPEHAALYEKIIEKGVVISEFPLGTIPKPYNFPKRNRIISGMTQGTVVVEATRKSGSLITARLALEEGRDVYSIPGPADALRSMGTNNLIKEGAKLITCADEINEDILSSKKTEAVNRSIEEVFHSELNSEILSEKRCDDSNDQIMRCLNDTPQTINRLMDMTNMSQPKLYMRLTTLEMRQQIKRLFGGQYVRVT